MSLNRSLVWHCHSDSEGPPSERKSFSGCDGYQKGVEDREKIEEEGEEGGIGESQGFNAKAGDVCKIDVALFSGKWPMGSITCPVFNEGGKKNDEWSTSPEEGQTEEESTGGLHWAKLSSYVGAYHSQQALIINQQCPKWLTVTALPRCFTSLHPGWPPCEAFNR